MSDNMFATDILGRKTPVTVARKFQFDQSFLQTLVQHHRRYGAKIGRGILFQNVPTNDSLMFANLSVNNKVKTVELSAINNTDLEKTASFADCLAEAEDIRDYYNTVYSIFVLRGEDLSSFRNRLLDALKKDRDGVEMDIDEIKALSKAVEFYHADIALDQIANDHDFLPLPQVLSDKLLIGTLTYVGQISYTTKGAHCGDQFAFKTQENNLVLAAASTNLEVQLINRLIDTDTKFNIELGRSSLRKTNATRLGYVYGVITGVIFDDAV